MPPTSCIATGTLRIPHHLAPIFHDLDPSSTIPSAACLTNHPLLPSSLMTHPRLLFDLARSRNLLITPSPSSTTSKGELCVDASTHDGSTRDICEIEATPVRSRYRKEQGSHGCHSISSSSLI